MRIFDSIMIICLFLSALGLISCGPDNKPNSGASPQFIADDFKPDPVIVNPVDGAIIQVRDTKSTILDHPMSVLDQVYFPTLAGHDFKADPIRIESHATCTTNIGKFDTDAIIHDRAEIELLDLLPTAALFQPDPKARPAFCMITFEVFNKIESKYRVRIPGFELTAAQAKLKLALAQDHISIPELSERALVLATSAERISFLEFDSSPGQITLYCDGFWSSVDFKENEPFQLSRLLTAQAQGYANRDVVDGRTQTKQICRITREGGDQRRDNRVVSATPYFDMQFGPTPVQIRSEWILNHYETPFAEIPVFKIRIDNPFETDVPMAIPLDTKGALKLSTKASIQFSSAVTKEISPLKYTLSGAQGVEKDGLLIFTVPARQAVEILAMTLPPMNCSAFMLQSRSEIPPYLGPYDWFVDGFFFDLEPELIPLLQTPDNKYDAATSFNGTHKHIVFSKPAADNSRPLPGWAPWTLKGNYANREQSPPTESKVGRPPNIASGRIFRCADREAGREKLVRF